MYTCLGDLFSVGWMEFLENNKKSLASITFEELYLKIKERTIEKSQVLKFGIDNIE
jgi:Peptidase C13 family